MSEQVPSGEERKVEFLGGASIDGAPIAYIVVLAAVVTVLAFIPFSFVLATGGSFPLSQAIFGLVGFVLGPIAGAIAGGIGSLLGVFLAPQTAGVAPVTVWGGIVASFAAGAMVVSGKRRAWGIGVGIWGALMWGYIFYRSYFINGVSLYAIMFGSLAMWLGVLFYLLPTRILFARWVGSKNLGLVALGMFAGTWVSFAVSHVSQSAITYYMFNWPEEVWITLIPIVPIEYLTRTITAAIIGTGVIAGLRAIGVVKPEHALY
jgi:hypothetical protein